MTISIHVDMQAEESGVVKGEALNEDGEKRDNILFMVID
jgi:hypothetical protein